MAEEGLGGGRCHEAQDDDDEKCPKERVGEPQPDDAEDGGEADPADDD